MENYTDIIKEEIKIQTDKNCCVKSSIVSMLVLTSSFKKNNKEFLIEVNSSSMSVFRKLLPVISSSGSKRGDIECIYTAKGKIKKIRTDIKTEHNNEILDMYFDEKLALEKLYSKCCIKNFLKTAFLVCGSAVNPDKGYQLEINFKNHQNILDFIIKILEVKFNCYAKKTIRNENSFLYIKKFDNVVRFLNILEVNNAIIILQEKSMMKEIKSGVNRKLNCELNNMDRVIACGSRQMREFEQIKKSALWHKLDDISRKVVDERILSPDLSYAEIGKKFEMTKDQIAYYIKKITRKYLKYRNNLIE